VSSKAINRRSFLRSSAVLATGTAVVAPWQKAGPIGQQTGDAAEVLDREDHFEDFVLSNDKLKASLWPLLPHPRLFFASDDLPQLVEKSRSSVFRPLWDRLLKASKNPDADVALLALTHLLTGDEKYAQQAKEAIWKILDEPRWELPEFLNCGMRLATVATGYDWLYRYFTDEERRKVREVTIGKGIEPTVQACRDYLWWTTWTRCNWGMVILGGAGLACLSLLEDDEKVLDPLRLILNRFVLWVEDAPPDGGWGESLSYYNYAWSHGIQLVDALANVSRGKLNLYAFPFLQENFSLPLYFSLPDESGFVSFSNIGAMTLGATNSILRKLARKYQNPYAQWLAGRAEGRPSSLEFVWWDAGLSSRPPTDLPKAKVFKSTEWASLRSDWMDPAAILLAMKGGHNDWDHHHLDHNSFVLHAFGEPLLIDQGYAWPTPPSEIPYANDTVAHNTLLVNGQGQLDGAAHYAGGRGAYEHFTPLSDFVTTELYDAVMGDAKRVYSPEDLSEYIRQILFMRPRYFVVFDAVEAPSLSTFEWLFHSYGRLEVDGDTLRISARDAILFIRILKPERFDHQLATHTMEGTPNQRLRQLTDSYIRLRPSLRSQQSNLMAVLYPAKVRDADLASSFLTGVEAIEENHCLGLKVRKDRQLDVILFDRRVYERRRPRTIAAEDISTDGYRCAVRKDQNGRLKAFAMHGGRNLRSGNTALLTLLQTATVAITAATDKLEGWMNVVATSTAQLHAPSKPGQVIVSGKPVDFSYEEKSQLVSFCCPAGEHSVAVRFIC
jgi:heparinase II/III-like protein/uncharacterized protein DUF4962